VQKAAYPIEACFSRGLSYSGDGSLSTLDRLASESMTAGTRGPNNFGQEVQTLACAFNSQGNRARQLRHLAHEFVSHAQREYGVRAQKRGPAARLRS